MKWTIFVTFLLLCANKFWFFPILYWNYLSLDRSKKFHCKKSINFLVSFWKKNQLNFQNQIFILGAPFRHWIRFSITVIKIFVTHHQQLPWKKLYFNKSSKIHLIYKLVMKTLFCENTQITVFLFPWSMLFHTFCNFCNKIGTCSQ